MVKLLIVLALTGAIGLMALALGDGSSSGQSGPGGPRLLTGSATPNGVPSCAGAPVEPGGAAVIDNVWVDPSVQGDWCYSYTNPTPTLVSERAQAPRALTPSPTPNGVPECAGAPVEPGGAAIIDNVWVDPSVQADWCFSYTTPVPSG